MSKPFPPKPEEPRAGRYRHFKGDVYFVIGWVFDAEAEVWKVKYVDNGGNECCRTAENFLGEGRPGIPRYTRIDP